MRASVSGAKVFELSRDFVRRTDHQPFGYGRVPQLRVRRYLPDRLVALGLVRFRQPLVIMRHHVVQVRRGFIPRLVGVARDMHSAELCDVKVLRVAPELAQRRLKRNRRVRPERRQQMETHPRGAFGRLRRAAADPDWRTVRLHRPWIKRHSSYAIVFAVERDRFFREQAMDQLDRFGQTSRTLCTRNIQRGKLLGTISLAYSEIEPPAG